MTDQEVMIPVVGDDFDTWGAKQNALWLKEHDMYGNHRPEVLARGGGGRIDAKARGLSSASAAAENQALLNELMDESATMGQELWIGDGEFRTGEVVLHPHQRIGGSGILRPDGGSKILKAEGVQDLYITGVGFKGDYSSGSMTNDEAISLTEVSDVVLYKLGFENWPTTVVGLENVKDGVFERCLFDTIAGTSIRPHTTTGTDRRNERLHFLRNRVLRSTRSGLIGNGAFQLSIGGNIHRDLWYIGNYVDDTYVAMGMDWGENVTIHWNRLTNGTGEGIAMTGLNYDVAHNVIDAFPDAAGILFWTELETKGLRCTWNDVTGCAQGQALVWGDPGCVMDDILVAFNRFNGNGQGVLSYPFTMPGDDEVENYSYGNVTVCFNELLNNTNAPLIFSPPDNGGSVKHFGNWSEAGVMSPLSGSNAYWSTLRTIAGEQDTESIEYGVVATHLDGLSTTDPSEIRMWAGFDPYTDGSKGGGFGLRKRATFANNIDLILYGWQDNTLAEVAQFLYDGTTVINGMLAQPIVTVTADYEASGSDHMILVDASANDVTITLPYTGAVPGGSGIVIKRIDNATDYTVTIDAFLTEQIDGFADVHTLERRGDYMALIGQEPGWWIYSRTPVYDHPRTVTATGDLLATDSTVLVDATAGDIVLTLPFTGAVFDNFSLNIKRIDSSANTVTVSTFLTEQLDGVNDDLVLDRQWARLQVQKVGDGQWLVWEYTEPQTNPIQFLDAAGDILPDTVLCATNANGGAFTVTLPYTEAVPRGHRVTVKKVDASVNVITVDGFASDQIDGTPNATLTTQWQSRTFVNYGPSTWYLE